MTPSSVDDAYFMFDAAVASEALDGTLQAASDEDDGYLKYVPSDWRGYTNLCWAANWHRWFQGDANDSRGRMGWPDYFADAIANAVTVCNYYSSGDEIFEEMPSTPSALSGVFHWPTAGVKTVDDVPPSIDGRLDDACWAAAEWNGPFIRLANSVKDRTVKAQTSFAIMHDAKTLYVAVKCDEPDMAALKARRLSALYTCDCQPISNVPSGMAENVASLRIAQNNCWFLYCNSCLWRSNS